MQPTEKKKASQMPQGGFLRLKQILQGDEFYPPLFPVSRTEWFRGVKEGRYPKGIKISDKIVIYPAEEITGLLEKLRQQGQQQTQG